MTANPVNVEMIIKEGGFFSTVAKIKPFVSKIIRKFFAQLLVVKIEEEFMYVWVRGHEYDVSAGRINALFDLHDVDDIEHLVVAAKISEAYLARFMTGGEIRTLGGITSTTHYTAEKNALLKICSLNWYPTKNS